MTRAFSIEGLVRLQNYMGGKTLSDAQFFAVLNADVVEMPLSDGTMRSRYYRQRENDTSILFLNANPTGLNYISVDKNTKMVTFNSTNLLTGSAGSITTKLLADGAVTSSKLAPGLDVSGLFFILPAGTKFPYTLTEKDKTKLVNARFLVCVGSDGAVSVVLRPTGKSYVGSWLSIYSTSRFAFIRVTESVISEPTSVLLYDINAVRFRSDQILTAAQKLQARTNIGAAEDPNTSGDSQATLEEPPVADEETIP